MRAVRAAGWSATMAAVAFVGACKPAVAPPAAAPAPAATATATAAAETPTPVAVTPATTPIPVAPPTKPAEPAPATVAAPPPRPADVAAEAPAPAPVPAAVTPKPAPVETDPVKQLKALDDQILELQEKRNAIVAKMEQSPPETNPKQEYPSEIGGKSLEDWLKETHSTDPAVRQSAAEVITRFGPAARKPAMKEMPRLIQDSDSGVRMSALSTLGSMLFEKADKKEQEEVFRVLRVLLSNSVPGGPARKYATVAMGAYGTEAGTPGNISALKPLRVDPWWETRQALANTLGKIGAPLFDENKTDPKTGRVIQTRPSNAESEDVLRYLLENDPSAAVRLEAVFGLLAHGPPPFTTMEEYKKGVDANVDAITRRLDGGKTKDGKTIHKEDDNSVRVWLYVAHMMYDDRTIKDTLPKVAAYLQDQSLVVRGQTLNALASLGPKAEPVLNQVRECLELYKDQPILAAGAIGVLAGMGKNVAEGAIPDLEKFRAYTKDPELKRLAGEAIDLLSGKKKAADPNAKKDDKTIPKP